MQVHLWQNNPKCVIVLSSISSFLGLASDIPIAALSSSIQNYLTRSP